MYAYHTQLLVFHVGLLLDYRLQHSLVPKQSTHLSIPQAKRHLTPMANLKGARRPIPFAETSATIPDAIVAIPIAHVAIRNVSASKCEGNPRLWCSVTIHDSNAVASRVPPAPTWNVKPSRVEQIRVQTIQGHVNSNISMFNVHTYLHQSEYLTSMYLS